MNRPKTNINWIWWGLGAFFFAVIIFRIGAASAVSNFEGSGKKVGIVKINGPILSSDAIVSQLEKLKNRNDISAIVIRIDSPGGLVAPTQEIYEKVKSIRGIKPIVSSMGSVAASGGYYIACGTDRIIASAGTLTGSIGVLLEWANLEELGKNAGVKMYRIKSGKYKNVPSLFEEIQENERDLLTEVVDDTHEQFVQAVLEGRPGLEESRVRELADGRVFSGKQAFEAGLVDELGGYASVVRRLSEKLGLSPNEEVFQIDLEDSGISGLLGLASLERWMKQPFSGFRLNYLMH